MSPKLLLQNSLLAKATLEHQRLLRRGQMPTKPERVVQARPKLEVPLLPVQIRH
jgi:hypothetical protein